MPNQLDQAMLKGSEVSIWGAKSPALSGSKSNGKRTGELQRESTWQNAGGSEGELKF